MNHKSEIVIASVSSLLFAVAEASEPQLGRCYMDICSWSKTLRQEEIVADERGRLIMLELLGGESKNDNSKPRRIKWNSKPHQVYVFCSTRLPAVMIETEQGFQVDVFDFWTGIPGVQESAANLYRNTCHPGFDDLPEEDLARKFKYSPAPDAGLEIKIVKPTDIFSYIEKE